VTLDFSFVEEKLQNLGRAIFRGTWNYTVLSELAELNSSLELSVSIWKERKDHPRVTLSTVARRMTHRLQLVPNPEDVKAVELIWTKYAILLRAGRLLVKFVASLQELLSSTPEGLNGLLLSSLSRGTTQLNLSGVMERLERERVELLLTNLKDFTVTESPGFPASLSSGLMDTIRDTKELFWTSLTGALSCPTCYVSWIDTLSRSQLRAGLWSGDLASFGSPLKYLLDSTMLTTISGELFAEGLPSLDRLLHIYPEEELRRSQPIFGDWPLPLDIGITSDNQGFATQDEELPFYISEPED